MEYKDGRFRPVLTFVLVALHAVAAYGLWQCWQEGIQVAPAVGAIVLYSVSSLGITAGYHRYWTHGAYQCNRGVQYALAIAGAWAAEGPIIKWRRDHRQHHAFTDMEYDPHSPWRYWQEEAPRWQRTLQLIRGFFWAHVGWLMRVVVIPSGYQLSERQDVDPVVRWQHRWYIPLVVSGFVIPWAFWGMQGLWLAGFVRLVLHLHVTWCINSVAHLWGTRALDVDGFPYTDNQSRNNVVLAVLGMGEGWHGNHHAKQNAANLGRDHWWDPGWWLISTLRSWRWAWAVTMFPRRSW